MAEMWLGKGHQHAGIIGGPQNFLKAQMRTWIAAVVVSINEIDAKALEAFKTLPRRSVSGQRRADLGIVQRHARKKNALAVQVEIPAFDPKFAEAKAYGQGRVQNFVITIEQRKIEGAE